MIQYITSADAPVPAGHYSQATLSDGQLFISGQLPVDPHGTSQSETAGLCFSAQAELALSNVLGILESAGGSTEHIAKVTAYIVGIENWDAFNRVFAKIMGPVRPARAVVPVPELHFGFLVEVDAVAVGLGGSGPAASGSMR